MQASIIIPTLGRGDSLKDCLASIERQDYKNYEIIIVKEEGPLAHIRNLGAKRAKGDTFIFIDDDVETTPMWLRSIMGSISARGIGGVSGPAVIRRGFRGNRDIFRYRRLKAIYDQLFLDGRGHLPGHISRAGTWTTGACDENCTYYGEVDFLEACNMAFTREAFELVGGFDERYQGIGDWSEPDLAFRVRKAGYKLWFTPAAKLYHNPSQNGVYKKRLKPCSRMENYELFASRWVEPNWKHSAYKAFLRTYYFLKEKGIV